MVLTTQRSVHRCSCDVCYIIVYIAHIIILSVRAYIVYIYIMYIFTDEYICIVIIILSIKGHMYVHIIMHKRFPQIRPKCYVINTYYLISIVEEGVQFTFMLMYIGLSYTYKRINYRNN
jgi:hypothetical protein